MKNVAVVCNNIQEWKHFVDCLIWHMSKQNLPYKTQHTKYFIDKSTETKYHFIRNIPTVQHLRGIVWSDYILLANPQIVDLDLLEYLGGKE